MIYLVGSGQNGALEKVAARAMSDLAARGVSAPRVAVTYAPIAESPQGFAFMRKIAASIFSSAGADAHTHATVERFAVRGEDGETDVATARAAVERADLVFIVGGDPVVGAKLLLDAGADAWVKDAHARGAAVLGVSAGSIMLGARWASWPDVPPDAPDESGFDHGRLVPCLSLLADLVLDCHDEDSDWQELRAVKAMCQAREPELAARAKFIGIPTGGAIVIHSNGVHEHLDATRAAGAAPFVLA